MIDLEVNEKIKNLIGPVLKEAGVELIEFVCRREGRRMVLRLLVDKPAGISLDDCSALNKVVGSLLDENELIEGRYFLEVCSPGLDRPLRTKEDFQRHAGELVNMIAVGPLDKNESFTGRIKNASESKVDIEVRNDVVKEVSLEKIIKAKLEIKFK